MGTHIVFGSIVQETHLALTPHSIIMSTEQGQYERPVPQLGEKGEFLRARMKHLTRCANHDIALLHLLVGCQRKRKQIWRMNGKHG